MGKTPSPNFECFYAKEEKKKHSCSPNELRIQAHETGLGEDESIPLHLALNPGLPVKKGRRGMRNPSASPSGETALEKKRV